MVITGLVAVIWVYFGRLYLIRDPGEWRIANQQLGYPPYIIPLIGVTHILGGRSEEHVPRSVSPKHRNGFLAQLLVMVALAKGDALLIACPPKGSSTLRRQGRSEIPLLHSSKIAA
jgi:hypothetical protein